MKTLAEQIANKCVHYRSPYEYVTCNAGFAFASVKTVAPYSTPCFLDQSDGCKLCPKQEFPTPEAVAAEVAEDERQHENLTLARRAAHADAEAHGLRKGHGGNGNIKCPVCETGTLHYSVAGYNGHMHGRCSTEGCVSWME